jgi:hypothetical protein
MRKVGQDLAPRLGRQRFEYFVDEHDALEDAI